MTRSSLNTLAKDYWWLASLASALLGVTGARLYTDADRQTVSTIATALAARASVDSLQNTRIARLEIAVVILALKACGESAVPYERMQLQCDQLGASAGPGARPR
jgi:hypothetical protein